MTIGNIARDAELKQWLGEVCPVIVKALKLPRNMERAASQALGTVSVGTALRWVDMLGAGKADDIRTVAQSFRDAAARLSSTEGQQAVQDWEANHRVVPVLRALQGAVKAILAFWRAGGRPSRAMIRALAAVSVSQVALDGVEFREEAAPTIGGRESSAVCLIDDYTAAALASEMQKMESLDRLISRSLTFGPWVRSFWLCLKLKAQGIRQKSEMDPEWGHPLWRLSLTLREIAGGTGKR
jgi:hypothetical protein